MMEATHFYDPAMGSYPSLYSVFVYPATTKVEFAGVWMAFCPVLAFLGLVSSCYCFKYALPGAGVTWKSYFLASSVCFCMLVPFGLSWLKVFSLTHLSFHPQTFLLITLTTALINYLIGTDLWFENRKDMDINAQSWSCLLYTSPSPRD